MLLWQLILNCVLLHFRDVKLSSLEVLITQLVVLVDLISQWLRVRMMAEVTLRQLSLADYQTKKIEELCFDLYFNNKIILLWVTIYNCNLKKFRFLGGETSSGGGGDSSPHPLYRQLRRAITQGNSIYITYNMVKRFQCHSNHSPQLFEFKKKTKKKQTSHIS